MRLLYKCRIGVIIGLFTVRRHRMAPLLWAGACFCFYIILFYLLRASPHFSVLKDTLGDKLLQRSNNCWLFVWMWRLSKSDVGSGADLERLRRSPFWRCGRFLRGEKIPVFNHTPHKSFFFSVRRVYGTLFIIARTLIAECGHATDVPDVGLLFTNLLFDSRPLLHLQKNRKRALVFTRLCKNVTTFCCFNT